MEPQLLMTYTDHIEPRERLWTPWRMRYIGGYAKEEGCIFCNRFAGNDDIDALVLYRGTHVFVVMNLFPYNTGHIMLVPNAHAADPADLPAETLRELGETLPRLTSALRRVLNCDGFNVGLNIGSVAGAGVAEHLHQHIVPRWTGDANFMPILSNTMVLPELIPVTYAKVRAEIERDRHHAETAEMILFDSEGRALLHQGQVPTIPLDQDIPVWENVVGAVPPEVDTFELAGWAGQNSTRPDITGSVALALRAIPAARSAPDWEWTDIEAPDLNDATRTQLQRAWLQLTPAG